MFLITFQVFRSAALLKRGSNIGVSCEYWQIFKNNHFEEHLGKVAFLKTGKIKNEATSKTWTRTLDPGPGSWTLDPDPRPWTPTLDLDPEKHGKQLDMEK